MKHFILFFALIFTCFTNNSFASFNSDAKVEVGNVLYYFQNGEMECLSEIDSEKKVFILLKSRKENTEVHFNKIKKIGKKLVLVGTIIVEDTEICASFKTMQKIQIAINPKKVDKTTLTGNVVYNKNNTVVMM